MNASRTAWVAVLIAVSGASALAAEVNYDFTVCTSSKRTPLEANAEVLAFGVESWGVVSASSTKLFEQASTHCVGYLRVQAGKPVGKGMCRWVVQGGDSGVGEFEYPVSGEPKWTWLAGTGRLKGISGGGTFREVFNAPVVDPAMSQGCRRDWGSANLP